MCIMLINKGQEGSCFKLSIIWEAAWKLAMILISNSKILNLWNKICMPFNWLKIQKIMDWTYKKDKFHYTLKTKNLKNEKRLEKYENTKIRSQSQTKSGGWRRASVDSWSVWRSAAQHTRSAPRNCCCL